MHFKKASITLVAFMAVLTLIACQSTAKRTTSSTSSSIQKGKITKNPKSDKETGSSCQTASPSVTVSESKATSLPDEVTNGLSQDAQSANIDKIYATSNAKVYYRSFEGGFSAQTPDFKGYTEEKVREILGAPETVIRDSNYIKETFKRQELENLKALYQSQYVTEGTGEGFLFGSSRYCTSCRLRTRLSVGQRLYFI